MCVCVCVFHDATHIINELNLTCSGRKSSAVVSSGLEPLALASTAPPPCLLLEVSLTVADLLERGLGSSLLPVCCVSVCMCVCVCVCVCVST